MRATMTALIVICLTTLSLGIAPPLTAYLTWMIAGERGLGAGLALVTVIGAACAIAYVEGAPHAPRVSGGTVGSLIQTGSADEISLPSTT